MSSRVHRQLHFWFPGFGSFVFQNYGMSIIHPEGLEDDQAYFDFLQVLLGFSVLVGASAWVDLLVSHEI